VYGNVADGAIVLNIDSVRMVHGSDVTASPFWTEAARSVREVRALV
jgi:hypothetical protein